MLDIHMQVQIWTEKDQYHWICSAVVQSTQNPLKSHRVIRVSYRQHVTESDPLFGTLYKEMLNKPKFFKWTVQ